MKMDNARHSLNIMHVHSDTHRTCILELVSYMLIIIELSNYDIYTFDIYITFYTFDIYIIFCYLH